MRHLAVLLVLALASCGDPSESVDAGAPPDRWFEPDAPDAMPAPSPPGSLASTSGGGRTTSAGHRLSVRIGAPQPLGRTESNGHRLRTGPGAIPWSAP